MKPTGQRRCPPSLDALAIVVTLTILGAGLFVWGPINPNVVVADQPDGEGFADVWLGALVGSSGSRTSGRSVGSDGRTTVDLFVTNHSFAPFDLTAVRIEAIDGDRAPAPTIRTVHGVPATVGHDVSAPVSVTVDARTTCATHAEATFRVLFEARTASGIVRTIAADGTQSITCDADVLPAPGPGPADPDAAGAGIERAFAVAYDFDASPEQRRAHVEDAEGLDAVVVEAMAGPYGGLVEQVAPRMVEIVFTSPTQATVLYDLSEGVGPLGVGRVGEARFVDGRWKVTRDTVCGDLALAEATCPPR